VGRPSALRSRSTPLAERFGLSLPTLQRIEVGDRLIRGNVDSSMKLANALAASGIELNAPSITGRYVS
jgi:hypothetical protein